MEERISTRIVYPLLLVWTASVVAVMILGMVLTWFRESDPVLVFWFFQSGVIAAVALYADARRRRSWTVTVFAGVAVALLTFFLFLYFPMGPAECEEWLQLEARQRARAESV